MTPDDILEEIKNLKQGLKDFELEIDKERKENHKKIKDLNRMLKIIYKRNVELVKLVKNK